MGGVQSHFKRGNWWRPPQTGVSPGPAPERLRTAGRRPTRVRTPDRCFTADALRSPGRTSISGPPPTRMYREGHPTGSGGQKSTSKDDDGPMGRHRNNEGRLPIGKFPRTRLQNPRPVYVHTFRLTCHMSVGTRVLWGDTQNASGIPQPLSQEKKELTPQDVAKLTGCILSNGQDRE